MTSPAPVQDLLRQLTRQTASIREVLAYVSERLPDEDRDSQGVLEEVERRLYALLPSEPAPQPLGPCARCGGSLEGGIPTQLERPATGERIHLCQACGAEHAQLVRIRMDAAAAPCQRCTHPRGQHSAEPYQGRAGCRFGALAPSSVRCECQEPGPLPFALESWLTSTPERFRPDVSPEHFPPEPEPAEPGWTGGPHATVAAAVAEPLSQVETRQERPAHQGEAYPCDRCSQLVYRRPDGVWTLERVTHADPWACFGPDGEGEASNHQPRTWGRVAL